MWCHLPTGFKRRTTLRFVAIIPVLIALFTTLIFPYTSSAAPGINQTLNFQGRLLRSTGGVVPDGYYNIEFKLYEGGNGQAAGNPGGSLAWTETYINNNGTNGVQIKNGMMSVNLGSKTPFGDSVDWNNDTLWLSMNVAGSAADCTAFNVGTCTADGEMTPMKRLTSTPYAMNAGALQGKKAENFVQLAQGVQEDASTNTSSIAINKTGSGDLLQLQNSGTDVLRVDNNGDIEFGATGERKISVGTAADDTGGSNLTVSAGNAGGGVGSNDGGSLSLQGGNASGAGGIGGSVSIDSGTGEGTNGYVLIGNANAAAIGIGSFSNATSQAIYIGGNNTEGSYTDVIIGSGGAADGGRTQIRGKDEVSIESNGTTRAVFGADNTLTLGNGSNFAPDDFRIQGTSSASDGVTGGGLAIQGGNATAGNANGGDLRLTGGDGSGTGSNGQVIIGSPTYTNSGLYSSATNLTVPTATVDSFGVLNLNAEAANVNFTLPAPSRGSGAAGRVIYVTAANGSEDFMLRANVGGGAGIEQTIPMKQNTTMTMIWGGSLWTVAGGNGAANLQSSYDNSVQTDNGAKIVLDDNAATKGLTVRDSPNSSPNSAILEVQGSSGNNLLSTNSGSKEYATNGGAEEGGGTPEEFSQPSWGSGGAVSVERYTTPGNNVATGDASVRINSTAPFSGAYNSLDEVLEPNTTYDVSVSVRLDGGSAAFTDFGIVYVPDGVNNPVTCTNNVTITADRWRKITCSFTTPASGMTSNNIMATGQLTSSVLHTYYVDNLSVTKQDANAPNVQIGGGNKGGATTLLTLDSASSAPLSGNNEDLLGSLYYDTTLGKIQCYEADGWGSCGASPDNIVSMTPEYSGAVMHGTGVGAMTADFCSDDLAINADICDTGDTFNYYQWTSPQTTTQEYGIYVTYKLPSTFQSFNPGSTALHGLTDDADSSVAYEVYRSDDSGLTQCGTEVPVSTGTQTNWQTGIASGSADPSTCDFEAGDSLVVKIIVESRNNANAYVGNLDFAFSNQ